MRSKGSVRSVGTVLTAVLAFSSAAEELPEPARCQLEDAREVCLEMSEVVPRLEASGRGQYERMAYEVMRWSLDGMLKEELPRGYTNRVVREAGQLAEVARHSLARARRILSGEEKDVPVPRFKSGNALRVVRSLLVGDRTWPDGRIERNVAIILNGWGHFERVRRELPLLNRCGYNFAQIEDGFYKYLPRKDVVVTNAIDAVLSVADSAWQADTRLSYLFSPHYVPDWLCEELPQDNGKCRNGFFPICIHNRHVNSIFADYCTLLASLAKDHPAILSYTLTNEPQSGDVTNCRSMRRLWTDYLKGRYRTIGELNAKWGESHKSFDEVPMQKFPEVEATPAGLEFIRCNRKVTADFHALLAAASKKGAPDKPCHSKVVSNELLYGPKHQTFWSIDPLRFGEIFDFIDNDPIAFVNEDPKSDYASRWQENEAGYDYLRSFADKPLVNTENHNVVDKNKAPLSPVHVYASLWQNVIHGQVATAFWCWERGLDEKSVMTGLAPEHPNCLVAMGRCSLDTQRLSVELAPIMAQRPSVLVLDSLSTHILSQDRVGYRKGVFNAYSALSFLGEPVGFVTDEALVSYAKSGRLCAPLDTAHAIVMPSTANLPREAVQALGQLMAKGIAVIAMGKEPQFDDFRRPLERRLGLRPLIVETDRALHGELTKLMGKWGLKRRPRAHVPGTKDPAFGVETRGYVASDGTMRISLCNQLRVPVRVDVGAPGMDLITGRPTPREIELESRVPMFVEISRKEGR